MRDQPFALYIVLGTRPELYFRPITKEESILLGESLYIRRSSQNGFYDYLRNLKMEIVGIRFSPFDRPSILEDVRSLGYTVVDLKRNYVEIYFQGGRELLATGLAEQEFGDDVLWHSSTGTHTIQIGVGSLTPGELDFLAKFVAVSS